MFIDGFNPLAKFILSILGVYGSLGKQVACEGSQCTCSRFCCHRQACTHSTAPSPVPLRRMPVASCSHFALVPLQKQALWAHYNPSSMTYCDYSAAWWSRWAISATCS
jgi:hypothetical protein